MPFAAHRLCGYDPEVTMLWALGFPVQVIPGLLFFIPLCVKEFKVEVFKQAGLT